MATPEALAALERGERWPGPDHRKWSEPTLFDMAFVKRAMAPPKAAPKADAPVSPSLLYTLQPQSEPKPRKRKRALEPRKNEI